MQRSRLDPASQFGRGPGDFRPVSTLRQVARRAGRRASTASVEPGPGGVPCDSPPPPSPTIPCRCPSAPMPARRARRCGPRRWRSSTRCCTSCIPTRCASTPTASATCASGWPRMPAAGRAGRPRSPPAPHRRTARDGRRRLLGRARRRCARGWRKLIAYLDQDEDLIPDRNRCSASSTTCCCSNWRGRPSPPKPRTTATSAPIAARAARSAPATNSAPRGSATAWPKSRCGSTTCASTRATTATAGHAETPFRVGG